MADTPTFGRYAEIPYDQIIPEQQDAYRSLIETRGSSGPNKIYVRDPKLAKVMGQLGAHFRTGYSLSEREREIAVNVILAKWGSAYPTNAHERAGKTAGLPADKVEAIRPSTFYRWYDRYRAGGPEALEDRPSRP